MVCTARACKTDRTANFGYGHRKPNDAEPRRRKGAARCGGARTHRAIGGRKPRGAGRFGLFQTQNPQQRRKGKEEIHTEKHPRHARTLSLQHEVAPLLFAAKRQCAPDAGKERKGPDARTEKRTIITPISMLALRYRSRRAGKLTEIVFI